MRQTRVFVPFVVVLVPLWSVDSHKNQATAYAGESTKADREAQAANWPQFRGPNAGGICRQREVPVDVGHNVLWKTPVPPGNSSPCIWGESLFLTACKDQKRLVVLCINTGDGRIRWEQEVSAERIENVHPRVGSPASPTPAADGERVYVFFGSVGLVCFDFQGRLIWRHDLGPFSYHLGWGAASSPIVYGDSVILNCDHDGESFLLALHRQSGQPKWRTPRPQSPPSYSTPICWETGGQTQIVVAGSARTTAYEADTGQEIWHVEQPESFVAATPVVTPQLLLVAAVDSYTATREFRSSARAKQKPNWKGMFENHDGNRDGKLSREEIPMMSEETFRRIDANGDGFLTLEELQADFEAGQQAPPPPPRTTPSGNLLSAIRAGGQGNATATHVVWQVPRVSPYVPSPLCYGDRLYVVGSGGIVSCFAVATGRLLWKDRLGASGDYYASPVAGAGKMYLVSLEGEITVVAEGEEPRVLARKSLGERCLATPALVGGRLYVRTERNLQCFGRGGAASP
ncbi:MAG: outer membrane protein assembly factor BamB family protein [Planctomycetota bacterium]|jgi:outer membrane protein assembly factor BamB